MVVHLVHDEEYRFVAPPENLCNFFIEIGDAGLGVYHKQNGSGFFNGDLYLASGCRFKYVIRAVYKTSGVYNGKTFAVPFTKAVFSIPGYPGEVIRYGIPHSDEAIVEGGFPDVRATNDSNDISHGEQADFWRGVQGLCIFAESEGGAKVGILTTILWADVFVYR